MPRKLVPRLGIALAGAALVATPLAACTDEGPAAPDGGSIAGMLSLVPDPETGTGVAGGELAAGPRLAVS